MVDTIVENQSASDAKQPNSDEKQISQIVPKSEEVKGADHSTNNGGTAHDSTEGNLADIRSQITETTHPLDTKFEKEDIRVSPYMHDEPPVEFGKPSPISPFSRVRSLFRHFINPSSEGVASPPSPSEPISPEHPDIHQPPLVEGQANPAYRPGSK